MRVGELLLPNIPGGKLDAKFSLAKDTLVVERLDFAAPGAIALGGNGRIERVSEAPAGQVDLSLQAMAPNAGAASIAAGIGLFCLTFRGLRGVAWVIGVALVLLGGVALIEELYGFDLGVDRILLGSAVPQGVGSVRMAPGIATSLILFGLALLCAKGDRLGSAISQILAIAMPRSRCEPQGEDCGT